MWARIRDYLLRNLGLKLASLLLALLFYAHVVTDQQRESRIMVGVSLTGLADTLAIVGTPPSKVAVKVRGKWKDLIRLGLTNTSITIDLAGASPGRFQRSISVEDVQRLANDIFRSEAMAATALGSLDGFALDRSQLQC